MTTTVSLLLAHRNQVFEMMLCGMGSSALVQKVPAAVTIQTYLGLTQPSTTNDHDDIELRVCSDESITN